MCKTKRKNKSNKDTDSNFSSKIQDIFDIACDIDQDIEDSDDYKIATNGANASIPNSNIDAINDNEPEEALNCDIVLDTIPKIRPCSIGHRQRTYSDFAHISTPKISTLQIHRDVNVNIEQKLNRRNRIREINKKHKIEQDVNIKTDLNMGGNDNNMIHRKRAKTKKKRKRKVSIASVLIKQAKSPKLIINNEHLIEDESNQVHRDDMLAQDDGWWVCSEYYDNVDDFQYDSSFISHGVEI